ncbi:Fic family protein [Cellulomonas soli]|uniref:Fido domain-containing protein n=1 Tax=Cellulomonas soli TaxID=931535 RepID=A0A512PEE0_9CELL|nr:Fic family protein [Cellulomonas soli]NYI58926.1 Fic family protein [Cellulomonas soli]GEP69581.1 hypothetical protein CSO01_22960 [Cellulomonas soli]
MAHWERVSVPPDSRGVNRRERQGGSYLRYHPDLLPAAARQMSAEVNELVVDASARVAALGQRLRDRPLRLLYATLLRSESIASSWIEGLRDTPRNVMAARVDDVDGASGTSREVVRNLDAMEQRVDALVKPAWTHQDVHAVHESLLAHRSDGRYRNRQVYIGGSSPLTAQYLAPPEDEVVGYMDDLLRFVNTAGDPPLVKAALVHAQFETIHPYEDGNGRTGRVLFHGVLARAGTVDQGVLPLSLVLRDDVEGYVRALTAFRHDGREPEAATEAFLTFFMDAVLRAADLADETIDEVVRITEHWRPYVARLRTDSKVHDVLDLLTEQPVLTRGYISQHLGVTAQTAIKALAELEKVGIVQRAGGRYRRQQVFQAGEVLALMDRYVPGPPTVHVPPPPVEVPVRRYGGPRCGHQLPRKGVPCTLPVGHPGPHRAV